MFVPGQSLTFDENLKKKKKIEIHIADIEIAIGRWSASKSVAGATHRLRWAFDAWHTVGRQPTQCSTRETRGRPNVSRTVKRQSAGPIFTRAVHKIILRWPSDHRVQCTSLKTKTHDSILTKIFYNIIGTIYV